MDDINQIIGTMAVMLDRNPTIILRYVAMYLMAEYDRAVIPDWVAALAGGNPDNWDAVVNEIQRLKAAEALEAEDEHLYDDEI